jgi:hypothetical protein
VEAAARSLSPGGSSAFAFAPAKGNLSLSLSLFLASALARRGAARRGLSKKVVKAPPPFFLPPAIPRSPKRRALCA